MAETADAQSSDAETAAALSGTQAETPTAHSPTQAETDAAHIRCRNRRTLRSCPDAFQACERELDESVAQGSAGKNKRKRNKGKSPVRCGRGLGKPRDPVHPKDRPKLMVVGDVEFTALPECTKVITTIRLLTLENLPGPYRSYYMFPLRVRFVILQQFLQRYSWSAKEDVGRCLDVFEKIAAEAYMRELNETRQQLTKKYGNEKEKWKDFPPKWCKNIEAWKGLCDMQEKGYSVGLKDVFDKTHMRNTPEGKVYLTPRAKEAAERFDALKGKYGVQMEEEQIWEKAVKGEDFRGRLFGFGFRGRTSKSTRVLDTVEASPSGPTRSTATSAADANRSFSNVEVA
ncbi:hypothetical protein FCM35_KLT19382 [Carex littledalei]|uniref:Uncharacterized protein n=1 Tax=Carex littledalei TaxID=544730 RepID=A0A833RCP2_9POAL|nr:hypothetical protein FCM35_KLT19382 [Carex littledalei]